MKQVFNEIKIITKGQNLYNFTPKVIEWVQDEKLNRGILNINILHTSASILVQENADSDVMKDMKIFFDKLVPMDSSYIHKAEGKDDMPAHIKSALTNNQISLSIRNAELLLGTWQGLYLFEHRIAAQNRVVIHHFLGE